MGTGVIFGLFGKSGYIGFVLGKGLTLVCWVNGLSLVCWGKWSNRGFIWEMGYNLFILGKGLPLVCFGEWLILWLFV